MKVVEFYEKNVSTVYYSKGFSILFLMWKKCIFGLYFFVFQLLLPIPEPCTSSRNETGEGSMLGERAGISTGSPWSITKGFPPALCFLLVMKASSYLACRAALPSGLSLSSALSCPACFLSVLGINFPELYSSKPATHWETHLAMIPLPEVVDSTTIPNELKQARLRFSYCIYNLTQSFCIQPS